MAGKSTTLKQLGRRLAAPVLIGCLALMGAAALPAAAMASFPWSNQSAMLNEPSEWLRSSFLIDTKPGEWISRQLFLSEPYIGFYEHEGFDRNFFTWAPDANVEGGYLSSHYWTGCEPYSQVPVAGGPSYCAPSGVRLEPKANLMRHDVQTGALTGLLWGETFVSTVCGNWSPANIAAKPSPEPAISGVVYEDMNADGAREAGDTGLQGWTVELFYGGKYIESTTTAADGSYSLRLDADTLPIGGGTYEVREVARAGWTQSQAPAPLDIPYGAGDTAYPGNDFGNWRPAVISGHKFDDSDVDGVWGPLDKGLSGWTIGLSGGAQPASATTGSGGGYSFSVKPGTYTVEEEHRGGWRQTTPGGAGTRTYTLLSGQTVENADFGNVCLGGVTVAPIDESTGRPVPVEVRLEEVSVPGILRNEPPLPLTETGASPTFGELLPGTYRIVAFLSEHVFTTDPHAQPVEGRFAIVEEVEVNECETTTLPLQLFTGSTPGEKVTGGSGIQIAVPGGFATSGFEFMAPEGQARGTLQYDDHAGQVKFLTREIEALYVSGDVAYVWGKAQVNGALQRFRLRLLDADERHAEEDRFELTLAGGYQAGQGETIEHGHVEIHR